MRIVYTVEATTTANDSYEMTLRCELKDPWSGNHSTTLQRIKSDEAVTDGYLHHIFERARYSLAEHIRRMAAEVRLVEDNG